MNSDILIAIAGEYGTLSEIAYGISTGRRSSVGHLGGQGSYPGQNARRSRPDGPERMRVIRLTLAYDGTDFSGWQRQPGSGPSRAKSSRPSPGSWAKKFRSWSGPDRRRRSCPRAGRKLRSDLRLEDSELRRALNSILSWDVRILSARTVPAEFHARKSARSKVYRYRIINSHLVSPF